MTTEEVTTTVGGGGKRDRWARSGYYRKPNKGREASWITVSHYKGGNTLQSFVDRGFQRLGKYGDVTLWRDTARTVPDEGGTWGPILRHPDGPAEFPVSQIITYRWYRKGECPVPGVRWPQLKGIKIIEYQCPQCNRHPFLSAIDEKGEPVLRSDGILGLGHHLQVTHSWDRLSLMAYGERTGIDFNAVGGAKTVTEYEYDEEPEAAVEEEPEFEVEEATQGVTLTTEAEFFPTTSDETVPQCECGWVPKPKAKNPQLSVAAHKRMHCPLRQEEPVTA